MSQRKQQSKPDTTAASSSDKRGKMSAQSIGVIINGYPNPESLEVAKVCAKRGYRVWPFGLATDDAKESTLNVPDVGTVSLLKFSDKAAKTRLDQAVKEIQKEGLSPIVVDTTDVSANVQVYNELKVPFVLQSKGGEAHVKAVKDTEEAKTFALISETMNKRMAAFDSLWPDWSRRYPGLFDDYEGFFRSTHPRETPKSLLDSFSDLTNRNFALEHVQPFEALHETPGPMTEGHVTREYTFKDGSGTSSFSFRSSMNDKQEYAENVADSVAFLARKSREIARPQVYSILDVAEHPRAMLLL